MKLKKESNKYEWIVRSDVYLFIRNKDLKIMGKVARVSSITDTYGADIFAEDGIDEFIFIGEYLTRDCAKTAVVKYWEEEEGR